MDRFENWPMTIEQTFFVSVSDHYSLTKPFDKTHIDLPIPDLYNIQMVTVVDVEFQPNLHFLTHQPNEQSGNNA